MAGLFKAMCAAGGAAALPDPRARRRYLALIAYFIGATYLIPSSASIGRFSFAYFALVIPAWIYVLLNWQWLFKAYRPASWCLVVFCGGAVAAALAQGNPSLAYNAIFLSAIAIVILNSEVYITPRELNALFLLCVVGSVAVYWGGITDYGFLPGQAEAPACHEAMSFRVSLFRVLTESAILSLFVVITNVFFAQGGPRTLRVVISVLAVYFLLLAGIRTLLIAVAAVLPILLYQVWSRLEPGRPRAWALSVLVWLGFAAMLVFGNHYPDNGARAFMQNYLFRTATCDAIVFRTENASSASAARPGDAAPEAPEAPTYALGMSKKWLQRTANRSCNASYHLHLISRSPWIGNRSAVPASEGELIAVGCQPGALSRYCEACTLATYWLSKAGVAAVALLLCFVVLLAAAVRHRDLFGVACLVAFGAISIGWGVSFVPYNFTFLLMMSVPAMSGYRSRAPGPSP